MSLSRNPLMSDAGTLIRPVSRATLPQEIVKALTDLIMKRVWKPGDLIPSEKELAIRFQVGRSTIREAVKSLVVLGVLEARAGEGSFVREPTSELLSGGFRWGLLLSEGNLDDFVDVRVLIEVECARRAAANRTDDLVSQLDATIEDMRSEPMDHGAFMDSDTRFHLGIAHAPRTRSSKLSARPSIRLSGSGIQRPITSRRPTSARSPSIARSRTAWPRATWTPRAKRCERISSLQVNACAPFCRREKREASGRASSDA
jgi:DNA-binding GntR family transcriptional regulator